jgi:hypothetical protein
MQHYMQNTHIAPTYVGYVDTMFDALLLFEACRIGTIRSIKQRPSKADRDVLIRSGTIFVWNENETNIRRWTDGRCWSSARPRGDFILYYELSNDRDSAISSKIDGVTGQIRDENDDGGGGNMVAVSSPSGSLARQKRALENHRDDDKLDSLHESYTNVSAATGSGTVASRIAKISMW